MMRSPIRRLEPINLNRNICQREEKVTKQYRRYLINGKINQGKDTDEGKIDWK